MIDNYCCENKRRDQGLVCIYCSKPIRFWQRSKPELTGRYHTIREHSECQRKRIESLRETERKMAPVYAKLGIAPPSYPGLD